MDWDIIILDTLLLLAMCALIWYEIRYPKDNESPYGDYPPWNF